MTPLEKFSTTTSLHFTSSLKSSRARGCVRFRVQFFLLMFRELKTGLLFRPASGLPSRAWL